MSDGDRRPFEYGDLFSYNNDPEYNEVQPGLECWECGAAIINTDRHVEWHNKDRTSWPANERYGQ